MKINTLIHNLEVSIEEVLVDYTQWLMKKGYTDTDTMCENPTSVEEYLKDKDS